MSVPTHAMLLAAGLGTRMRPLTTHTPKPMLKLGGRALLDHALDRLAAAGVTHVVINTHWRAEVIEAHVAGRPDTPAITLRHEPDLLDTGGAVRAALADDQLGAGPFLVVNGDAFWLDGPTPALNRLAFRFDPAADDVRLLLCRTQQVHAEVGPGDFWLNQWARPYRRAENQVVPYIYAGIQIATPALFADTPGGAFSTNILWDRAIEAGRAATLVHDGLWFHLSTPEDLAEADLRLNARETGESR